MPIDITNTGVSIPQNVGNISNLIKLIETVKAKEGEIPHQLIETISTYFVTKD